MVKEYSPSKNGNGQTIAVRETRATRSCAERKESALTEEFLNVLKDVFDKDSYLLVSNKFRKVRVAFNLKEAMYITRAWNHVDSVYASLNDILSKMKKSGWTKAEDGEDFIFSKNDISDDPDNMTPDDLVANQSLLGNNTVPKDLSANDCYTNKSDQLRDVKGIIDEGVDI